MDSSRVPALLDDISRFVLAEANLALLEDEEEFMVARARPVETATTAVEILARALEHEVAIPLLAARTRDDFTDRLLDCMGKFTETRGSRRRRSWSRCRSTKRIAGLQASPPDQPQLSRYPHQGRGPEFVGGIERGMVFWASVKNYEAQDSEHYHDDPCPWVVVSSATMHGRLPVVLAAPLTSKIDKQGHHSAFSCQRQSASITH